MPKVSIETFQLAHVPSRDFLLATQEGTRSHRSTEVLIASGSALGFAIAAPCQFRLIEFFAHIRSLI